MNVNDYNDPIAEFLDDINQLREQLELKDQILKSVARQGIEQKALITELCDALEGCLFDLLNSSTAHGRQTR